MSSGALIGLVTVWAVALIVILLGFGAFCYLLKRSVEPTRPAPAAPAKGLTPDDSATLARLDRRLAVLELVARRFAIREGLTRDSETEPPHEGA